MTSPVALIRRQRRQPARPRIIGVTNHWRVTPDGSRRGILVQHPDGTTAQHYLQDEHPALVRYLDRLHAAA